jgi:hypothetical protein
MPHVSAPAKTAKVSNVPSQVGAMVSQYGDYEETGICIAAWVKGVMEYGIDAHWEEGSGSVAVRVSNAVAVIRWLLVWSNLNWPHSSMHSHTVSVSSGQLVKLGAKVSSTGNLEHTAVACCR